MQRFNLRCLFGGLTAWAMMTLPLAADDWPQWRGPQRDGVWREESVAQRFSGERIETKWQAPLGAGYSGPTVAEGRVYVMDRHTEPKQIERIVCVDAQTGREEWVVAYDCEYQISYTAGPRSSVTIDQGRAFALGAMGHLHCLDAQSGEILWKKDLDRHYGLHAEGEENRMPIWGIAASPLIYQDLVIVSIGADQGASIVALDQSTGEEAWRALDDRGQYSSPILTEQNGRDVCVCWTGDSVAGLNPASGEVYWRHPMTPRNMPIGVATPLVDGGRIFVTSFYDGSLMLRMKEGEMGVEEVWRQVGRDEQQTEALHSIISTPVFDGNWIYGVDSYGELRCLDARTGERVWEDLTAVPKSRWSTIHFVRQGDEGDRYWLFNERGDLIIARLSPQGYEEISRAHLIEPTLEQLRSRQGVTWAHPAFADRHVFIRNDHQLVAADLSADGPNAAK